MSSAVPSGFVDLFAASSRLSAQVDIIGVVTDIMPPSRSKGPDWIYTFSIADPTFGGDYDQGLKIRFFKPTESELPKIQGTGDVIVLRSMKIMQWSGTTMAISSRNSTWTIFTASSIPEEAPSNNIQLKYIKEARAPIPSPEIMLHAICLCNSRDRSSFSEPISKPPILPQAMSAKTSPSAANSFTPAPYSRRDKFSLIKDVVIDNFYDVIGQVVKIFPNNGCVELYITDYTSNNLLYNYEWGIDDNEAISRDGDDYGYVPRASSRRQWPGPFGKMTMTVTLWPPHSYFANANVKELDFVHLRNMRVKYSRDAKMEGSLHSDTLWPDRVDVTILKDNREDDRVKDALRRKLEYTKRFKIQSQAFVEDVRGQKRKTAEDDKPLSKAQAKKRRKQELAEAKCQEALNLKKPHGKENKTIDSKRNEWHDGRHQTPDTSPPPARPPKLELNKNVKCSHSAVPPRPLSSIVSLSTHALTTPNGTPYTLPFQNIKSRTTARIIDFFPPNLADFAIRSRKPSEFDVLSDQEDSGSESSRSRPGNEDAENNDNDDGQQWEWRFALLLEEAGTNSPKGQAKATMTVYVAEKDADFLLKLDAENLHNNPQALAALREKLFLLWGDLEERKTADALEQKQARKAMGPIEWNGQGRTECGEPPRRKAFQCCLKEYGVRSRRRDVREGGDESREEDLSWERRWRMFGTTII